MASSNVSSAGKEVFTLSQAKNPKDRLIMTCSMYIGNTNLKFCETSKKKVEIGTYWNPSPLPKTSLKLPLSTNRDFAGHPPVSWILAILLKSALHRRGIAHSGNSSTHNVLSPPV